MLARIHSSAVMGIEAYPLEIEVDCTQGMLAVMMVGLPDAAVKESRDRVMPALRNSGFRVPYGRTVINLAPADMRKEGCALDLPIAVGVLAAMGQMEGIRAADYVLVGELALDGTIRPVAGALAMAIAARDAGKRGILLPRDNAEEAGVVQGVEILPVGCLNEAVDFLNGEAVVLPYHTDTEKLFSNSGHILPDLSEVKGQAHVKRALTVAAAGGHNLLTL